MHICSQDPRAAGTFRDFEEEYGKTIEEEK